MAAHGRVSGYKNLHPGRVGNGSIPTHNYLLRFVLFPLSIEHEATKIHGSQSAITISSCVLIGLSYLFCIICLVRWRKSDVLQDFILMYGDLHPVSGLSVTEVS
jgi:hypothetical protein